MIDLNWATRPNRPRSPVGGGLVAMLLTVTGSPWSVEQAAVAPRIDIEAPIIERLAPRQVGGAIVFGALIALAVRVASLCRFGRPNAA